VRRRHLDQAFDIIFPAANNSRVDPDLQLRPVEHHFRVQQVRIDTVNAERPDGDAVFFVVGHDIGRIRSRDVPVELEGVCRAPFNGERRSALSLFSGLGRNKRGSDLGCGQSRGDGELRHVVFDPEGVDCLVRDECGVLHSTLEEEEVGRDAVNQALPGGTEGFGACKVPCGRGDDDFRQQRVEEGADFDGAFDPRAGPDEVQVRVDADTGARGELDFGNVPVARFETFEGVFGSYAELDREAGGFDAGLGKAEGGEGGALGELELQADEVEAGNLFGAGVLDLDTGVDFEEVVGSLVDL